MNWVIAFHVIFVICWFAALFYLPRLFVYHAQCKDEIGNARFKVMERKLFNGIMIPSAALSIITGLWLLIDGSWKTAGAGFWWMRIKLLLVGLLLVYMYYCLNYLRDFKFDRNRHTHIFYRWFNEMPTVLLIAIIILAFVKPF
jgi:putative membrane protein